MVGWKRKEPDEELRKMFHSLTKKLRRGLMRSLKNRGNLSNEEFVNELVLLIEKNLYDFLGRMIKWTRRNKDKAK